MKRFLVALSALLAGLTALFLGMGWDAPALQLAAGLRSPALTEFMHFVAYLGSVRFLLPLNLLMISWTLRKTKKEAFRLPASTLLVWVLNALIKRLVGRARPAEGALAAETSLSFPSGHAMVNSFFVMTLAVRRYRTKKNPLVLVLAGLYIALMGFNRVYLGVHFPSDVLAGTSLGLLLSAAFLYWTEEGSPRKYGRRSTPSDDSLSDS